MFASETWSNALMLHVREFNVYHGIEITDCIELYFLVFSRGIDGVSDCKNVIHCCVVISKSLHFQNLQYMTDGVLLRETLKDADLEKYRYVK